MRPRRAGSARRHRTSRPLPHRAETSRSTGARWRIDNHVPVDPPPSPPESCRAARRSPEARPRPRCHAAGLPGPPVTAGPQHGHAPLRRCRTAPISGSDTDRRHHPYGAQFHGSSTSTQSGRRAVLAGRKKAETATWIPMRPGTRMWTAGRCPRRCRGARGARAQSTGTEQQSAPAKRLSHAMPRSRSATGSPGLGAVQISMVRHE